MKATQRFILVLAGAGAFLVMFVASLNGTPPPVKSNPDLRDQMFAGMMGDAAVLEKAMKAAEEALAKNPKDAEALVWHGMGVFYQCGQAFRSGDMETGGALFAKATEEMDRAVAIDPENTAVLVPRGFILLAATREMPPEVGDPLLEKGLADFEKTLALQAARSPKPGVHAQGEVLFGLAEGYSRTGNKEKAKSYFERIAKELPDTPYAQRAKKWLDNKPLEAAELNCAGCHQAQ
jgi:tetratricopeptide (TPR) repeat protein